MHSQGPLSLHQPGPLGWINRGRHGDALHRAYLRRLTSLSPAVQKRILTGDLPAEVTLKALLGADPPLRWSQQERWVDGLCGRRGEGGV